MTSRILTPGPSKASGIRRWRSLPLLLIASLFLLVACDGDEEDGTPEATDEATGTAAATETAEGTGTAPPDATPEVAGQYSLAPAGTPTPAATEAAAGGDGVQFALQAGIGHEAPQDVIGEWDIDITPDGEGLWDAEGTVPMGADVFASSCAHCHGADGTGSDLAPALVLAEGEPGPWEYGAPRTVANYWPYLTTYIDYINRAMPFDNPDSLSDEEVYSVVAWILNQNGMIEEDAVLNPDTIMEMNELPNLPSFFPCFPDACRPEPELRGGGAPNPDASPAPEDGTPAGGGG